ncbi:zinc ribbon domain-containing protein [Romboutsia lituseburensis]|uniref:zinc ribbon domain-containing protein n=1 Tax=Romboutsia lituseburensis TaxID=1537 RepID=UPI00215A84EC|nr:zinc ribbon domain-containing protein [Romboutsia lituseburensis]MCR8747075.1 zinc ribbon domain-containing protein [Romboutsia lituseburensis]
MSNLREKFDKKFSKVQDGIDKGREKIEIVKEKSTLSDEMNNYELKKTNLLLEMGELLYTKLRNGTAMDNDFDDYKSQIIDIDKHIYEISMKIKEIETLKNDTICECGSILNPNAKFCAECGKKIEIEEVQVKYLICHRCNSEVDLDSNYCSCCGFKIDNNL